MHPLRNKNPTRAVLSANERLAMWQIPWWEGPEHSLQVRLMLVDLGGYKWVLTGIDTDSELCFADLVVDENVHSVMKELEQRILYQFGWLIIISSNEGKQFVADNVLQWAENCSPQSNSLIENWSEQLKHWSSNMGK